MISSNSRSTSRGKCIGNEIKSFCFFAMGFASQPKSIGWLTARYNSNAMAMPRIGSWLR